jgi:hypothetical protein
LRKTPSVNSIRSSDDMAIVFKLIVSPNNRGDGYWKYNTAGLKKEVIVK